MGPEVRRRLAAAGLTYQGELSMGGTSWTLPDGMPLDVVELDEPWASEALKQAQTNRDAQSLPVLPLPYLVLMKFRAGRAQEVADVTHMLGQADETTLADVRGLFARHLPGDLDDLTSLIRLGQMELN